MKKRIVVGCCATVFLTSVSLAADLPATVPQVYGSGSFIPRQRVEWTGLYFGINAGYGWGQSASDVRFTGNPNFGDLTDPVSIFGTVLPGPRELSRTHISSSTNLNGGIAGGQIGFNWQAGMFVFGAEFDGQWAGQHSSLIVECGPRCTAAENVKIRSILTGRGRLGFAFDWFMPYVTGGVALVNGINDLTMTVGGVTANFAPLSDTVFGWSAGAGVEVALLNNWSAKLEYLHIGANGGNTTAAIPSALGIGFATTPMDYRENIVRIGLNYRFGPRGGPGVLEAPIVPRESYVMDYASLPNAKLYSSRRPDRALATAQTADLTSTPIAPPTVQTAPLASEAKHGDVIPRYFAEIGDVEDTGALGAERKHITASAKKHQDKGEDDSLRMKRIMSICTGC